MIGRPLGVRCPTLPRPSLPRASHQSGAGDFVRDQLRGFSAVTGEDAPADGFDATGNSASPSASAEAVAAALSPAGRALAAVQVAL